jgi:hypothetical protein
VVEALLLLDRHADEPVLRLDAKDIVPADALFLPYAPAWIVRQLTS